MTARCAWAKPELRLRTTMASRQVEVDCHAEALLEGVYEGPWRGYALLFAIAARGGVDDRSGGGAHDAPSCTCTCVRSHQTISISFHSPSGTEMQQVTSRKRKG